MALIRATHLAASPVAVPLSAMILFATTFGLHAAQAAPAHIKQQDLSAQHPQEIDAGQVAYDNSRYTDAYNLWLPQVSRGDATAAYGIGLLYDLGQGVPQDEAKALDYYWMAAKAGLAKAQFNLAVMYDSGIGTKQDRASAALWYARAAAQGNARSQYNLGQLYHAGEGVPQNLAAAEAWYEAAANNKLAEGRNKLALLHKGRSVAVLSVNTGSLVSTSLDDPLIEPPLETGTPQKVELSWKAPSQRVPVHYYVQLVALGEDGTLQNVASDYTPLTSVSVSLPQVSARYAWRVYTVSVEPKAADYVASDWRFFTIP